jgi:hypothetical protein
VSRRTVRSGGYPLVQQAQEAPGRLSMLHKALVPVNGSGTSPNRQLDLPHSPPQHLGRKAGSHSHRRVDLVAQPSPAEHRETKIKEGGRQTNA